MSDIALTLSSPAVHLVNGTASLAISVTNSATTPQRIVLGAFADGANPEGPSFTKIDRSLRTLGAGSTEQYVANFDTGKAPGPGDYGVKFIAYSADGAPEDYADQGQVVTLTVPAPAAAVAAKKFPWWIVAVGAVVVIALIAGVIYFVTKKPDAVSVAWAPNGPSSALPGSNTYYTHLVKKDCSALAADATTSKNDPVWVAVADVCAATKKGTAAAWATASTSFAKATEPAAGIQTCLDRAAWQTASRFVAAHKKSPSTSITVGAPASGLACKLQTAGVSPGSGLPAGGTTVTLAGYFTGTLTVHLTSGGTTVNVPATRSALGSYSFVTPTLAQAAWTVTVSNGDGLIPGFGTFVSQEPVQCLPLFCQIYIQNQQNFLKFITP